MDEFLNTTSPILVSNYLDEVPLWIPFMNHSFLFNSVSFLVLPNFLGIAKKKKTRCREKNTKLMRNSNPTCFFLHIKSIQIG
jgi:hypothetical protein